MAIRFRPTDIYAYLSKKVLGQEDVLKKISVSLYKHIHGIPWANILLIGNSGTGKTTIMKTVLDFYAAHEPLADYRTMLIMNANSLIDESGEVQFHRIFRNLEADVRNRYGNEVSEQELKTRIENATVCLDEIDKISARISDKVNVTGLMIQQALLTILEGENYFHETTVLQDGRQLAVRIQINTARMLFICGGAFEGLYDQVYYLVVAGKDARVLKEKYVYDSVAKDLNRVEDFSLREYMKIEDLFNYGMVPQFISRFSAIAILEDLDRNALKRIMALTGESPYDVARRYFDTLDIDFQITDEALEMIARQAEKNRRIGARSLRETFNRIVSDLQFDPAASGQLRNDGHRSVLVLTHQMLEPYLRPVGVQAAGSGDY